MGWVIISAIILVAGIVGVAAGAAARDGRWLAGGVAAVVVALLLFFIAGFKEVPTKSVGVVTSFGKVEGIMRPGIHHTWPWKKVNILNGTIQTTTFEGRHCLDIRIGGQQTACAKITIQWRILDNAAPELFNNYSQSGVNIMGEIKNAVVVRELEQVVNDVLGDYNPIEDTSALGINTGTGKSAASSQFTGFPAKIKTAMHDDIGGRVKVISILLPRLVYDNSTQSRLNQLAQQYGETAIAKQQIVTNTQQALANKAITASVAKNPAVLEYQCLQITQQAIKDGYQGLPAGWNCTGGVTGLSVGKK